MATQYSWRDAQAHLKKLIDDAQQGQTVLIVDENDRVVQLVPLVTTTQARRAGSARGQISMSADFDAPLADFDAYMQ